MVSEPITADYIKFILLKLKQEMNNRLKPGDTQNINKLISYLAASENILKDLYLISRVEKLNRLGNYLLFAYQKSVQGEINFENLSQNIANDVIYLKTEVLKTFEPAVKIQEYFEEPQKAEREEPEYGEIEIKGRFKVEDIENEMVTEEFSESDLSEGALVEDKSSYLELIKTEEETGNEAFEIPTNIIPLIPGEEKETEEGLPNEIAETTTAENTESYDDDIAEILEYSPEEERTETETTGETVQEITAGQSKATQEEPEEKIIYEDTPKTNKAYIEYETELFVVNGEIKTFFEKLSRKSALDENNEKTKEAFKSIIEKSKYMEAYSKSMSFEIISGVYETIKTCFELSLATGITMKPSMPGLFSKGLVLVESLIMNAEYLDYDETIKEMEEAKLHFVTKKETTEIENFLEENEEIKKEVQEPVQEKRERRTSTSQKEALKLLKQRILELEKLFTELDNIKGYYKNYEGLRRLTGSFKVFKELVKLSKALDMPRLAQLSEACYIFIKFLQNYRLDPFDKEIKEIFKYTLFNFKTIALDKPSKDFDVFVKYLNDPVKIFTQNKKN